jgi:DNA (cytosine-5)-methyltransferase 1
MKELTLGSLFDGIGGFPLAASRYGIKAMWASEIEPFPIKVTKIRIPEMKHLGDITKINGAEIAPVDIITFGSPCQDLSVAGKRAGLAGERSGLFMEAIRIIKEMRSTYEGTNEPIRPRFAVWENVPGAFSSNKGEDFRAVLEELCKVSDKTVTIPRPTKGKWNTFGAIMGDGWSIAWRVLDAQFWGVPQRRRRIFLVADFGGQSAPEILFKRQSLRRYIAESGEPGKRTSSDAKRSINYAVRTGQTGGNGIGVADDVTHTLNCANAQAVVTSFVNNVIRECGQVVPALQHRMGTGGNQIPLVHSIDCTPDGISGTVSSKWAKGTGGPAGDEHYNLVIDEVARPLSAQPQMRFRLDMDNVVMTKGDLNNGNTASRNEMDVITPESTVNCSAGIMRGVRETECEGCTPQGQEPSEQRTRELDSPLQRVPQQETSAKKDMYDLRRTGERSQSMQQALNPLQKIRRSECLSDSNPKNLHSMRRTSSQSRIMRETPDATEARNTCYKVRRLSPLECERLQGFPDGWTDIEGASDSARYKALGNSVAIPCVEYVMEGISEVLRRD